HGGEFPPPCAALAALLRGHVCLPDRGFGIPHRDAAMLPQGRTVTSGVGRTSRELSARAAFWRNTLRGDVHTGDVYDARRMEQPRSPKLMRDIKVSFRRQARQSPSPPF